MEGLQMYLYNCERCTMLFGVETKFEDQALIVCPSCQKDDQLEDAGTGDVNIVAMPEGDDGDDMSTAHPSDQ